MASSKLLMYSKYIFIKSTFSSKTVPTASQVRETGSESEVEEADCWVAWTREGRKKFWWKLRMVLTWRKTILNSLGAGSGGMMLSM